MATSGGGGEMNSLRNQAIAQWQALSAREQRGLSALGIVLAGVLLWSIAVAPALHVLSDSNNRRIQMSQQQAHMLSLQLQAQALQTRTPLSRDEAIRHLQSLTPAAHIQLTPQGDRVVVQLKAVPASTLAHWLAQARSQAQALPVEAHLTRGTGSVNTPSAVNASAMTWDGNLVLRLPNRSAPAN